MSGERAGRRAWTPPGADSAARPRGPEIAAAAGTAAQTGIGLTAIIVFVIACAVVADRVVVGVSTGGRGALSLLPFIAPAAALIAIARFGAARTLAFARSPVFLVGVAPYLVFALILPFLGVMFTRYPERTLISSTEATTAFSFMVLGAAASTTTLRQWRPWIMTAIVLQLVYAAGQLLYLGRGPGWELFGPLHAWDLSYQVLYGAFVQARGTGLYFNPNELGLWAGAAAILAWVVVTPSRRLAVVILSVGTLALSQSRGASVALIAAACVGVAMAVLGRRTTTSGAIRTAVSLGLASAIAVIVVVMVQPSQGLLDRFGALAAIWVQGPRADANLAGRLDYWQSVIALNAVYPWGTLGPPEMLLGTAVDSTWFRVFAQGSVPYVGALVLLLAAPFWVRKSPFGDALVMMTVLMAVAGLTQTPFGYPVALLYWALLGAAIHVSLMASAAGPAKAGANPIARGKRSGLAYGKLPDRRTARRRDAASLPK